MVVKKQFSSFQNLLDSCNIPVLVDFYATWCGPCHIMEPILDEVGGYWRNYIQIVKVDTDKYPGIASQYQVGGLPTLILFKNGQPVLRIEGVIQANQLNYRLQSAL